MTKLSLIVAMDRNRLIGRNNALPWQMPADLAYFKKTTMGKPIVMGRKTYESIGRPLPGRDNLVVSRNPAFEAPGCILVQSIDDALEKCRSEAEIMLIGGATLYQQAIEKAGALYITFIHHEFEGDTWFPDYDEQIWKLESKAEFEPDERNQYAYSFVKYIREI